MMKVLVFISVWILALGNPLPCDESTIEEYIVGGRPTDIKEIPYQIGLLQNGNFICGGSIISSTYVLTAAHCVIDYFSRANTSYSIRAGSSSKISGGIVVPAKKVVHHLNFSLNTFDYDIAVVELEFPLKFSSVVKVIKIRNEEPADGELVKTSGWGCLKENGTKPIQLQSVDVPMVNRKICEKNYKDYMPITKRMICAGVEGKDSCQGDSGGPLAYKGTLVGVVSFGKGCARKDYPGVYSNLADPEIRKFIKENAKV